MSAKPGPIKVEIPQEYLADLEFLRERLNAKDVADALQKAMAFTASVIRDTDKGKVVEIKGANTHPGAGKTMLKA